jgi:hypothetical protein
MKQKPILFLATALLAIVSVYCSPVSTVFSYFSKKEGYHPKNVNLAISCPDDVIINVNASCSTEVELIPPTTTCAVTALSYSIDGGAIVNVSGPSFPTLISIGNFSTDTLMVTWTITDDCMPSGTMSCPQLVMIQDDIDPTITCPADVSVGNFVDGRRRTGNRMPTTWVDVAWPDAEDNCGLASVLNDYNNTDDASDSYPLGTTSVCWTATDFSGNTDVCCMNITVFDNSQPIFSCPDTLYAQCEEPFPYELWTEYLLAGGNASDETGIDTSTFDWVSDSTDLQICPETIYRKYKIGDTNGNIDTCTQIIIVVDTIAPIARCKNVTIYLDATGAYNMNPMELDNGSTDDCDGPLTFSGIPPTFFGCNDVIGGIPVPIDLIVTDQCGNSASCRSLVTVRDTIKPTINCPAPISINTNVGFCYASNINLGTPTRSDNCLGLGMPIGRFNNNPVNSTTQFPVGINIVVWTVTDISGNTATCTQTITVVDSQVPVITCPADQTVSFSSSCNYVIPNIIPSVLVNENCTYNITQSPVSGTVATSPSTLITITVTDLSGNSATCNTRITAIDNVGPNIVCKDTLVIAINEYPEIPAHKFITSASDNCSGNNVVITARRMGNICGTQTPDDFGPYINLCCDDVNDTLTIVVRVTDQRNNFTDCMVALVVQDKLVPSISIPLPDISVSCEFPLNLNNLNVFGTFVPSGTTRQNIVINDPNTFYPPSGIAGQSGVFNENCPNATVTSTLRNLLTMCNTGEIKRDFVIRDIAGNITTFTQTIFVIDRDKFDRNDITWPSENVYFDDCNNANPPIAVTGSPIINNDNCSQAAATQSDQTFAHPLHCKYIRRTWTVIDWCQYRTNVPNSPGKWTFVQNIYVTNKVAPVINAKVCRDTMICTGNGCDANITFNATGTDDCIPVNINWSYKIDINDNGGTPDFTGSGATVTRVYPMGTHRLTWEAKDGCNNISTCSFRFTVRDCKAPNAVAMQGIAINLTAPMAMAEIWASDFNNLSFDNCTPNNQLKYSFSSDVNDKNRVFTCDNLGRRMIEFWVTDLAGNQSKTITFVTVQDNHGLCTNNGKIKITGNVYTEEKVKVSDTKVKIDGGETEGSLMTDQEGTYSFEGLTMYNDYYISPTKEGNYLEGLTTLDLVLIQRHILGIKKLDSPYKMIAADANNSKSVTASDIVELRKLILGVNDKLSNNASWRFVDAGFKFDDIHNPWPFSENLNYEVLETNMTTSDFIAIKLGDVNGSVAENLSGKTQIRYADKINLNINDITLPAGVLTNIPVAIGKSDAFVGMQWTFELSPGLNYYGIEAEALNIKNDQVAEVNRNGKRYITVAFDDLNGIQLQENVVMFDLIVRADKASTISSLLTISNDVTPALAYDMTMDEKQIQLEYRSDYADERTFVSQNHPNPFKDETVIKINQKSSTPVLVSIFDAKGELISNSTISVSPGQHIININAQQLDHRFGIFFVKVKSKELNEVVKILRIE